ncbi:5'-nucleotidase C-terminal domain-containing protein [Anaerolineales bacterium HSG6]|nr:5'-nucleotidase C-terminal domain-containing protein [Anaerolineales bacterium HSG6]
MKTVFRLASVFCIALVLAIVLVAIPITSGFVTTGPEPVMAQDSGSVVTVTILHTNDFHGRLETDYKGRGGSAYMATVITDIRAARGTDNVVLMDAGDAYFAAPPISQLALGESTIDIYNQLGYNVATFGNHEFDKGEAVVISRTNQSNFPWVGSNIVISGTDWTHPTWAKPYVTMTVGTAPDTAVLGIIGLDTVETPIVSFVPDTLEFKDFTETILHYHDEIMAQSDALVVLAHQGTEDAGAYKGLKTVARELVDAGKPVSLMIGGHQHQLLDPAVVVSGTTIVQSGYYGRYLGDVEVTINAATNSLTVVKNTYHTINNSITPNAAISTSVASWANKVAPKLNESVGVTNIDLTRDYNNESVMGDFVTDSMLWKANQIENGAVDIAFTNPGGLRADITGDLPYAITWGNTFDVLPFGNALTVMDLTGAQVQALLDQSATLFKGTLQTSGATWSWYNDTGDATPTAWGAYDVKVNGAPLERDKVYRVATNDFLATGKDGWVTFAEGTNRNEYLYADLQESLNEYIATISPIEASDIVGGRIKKLDKVVTILHTNDTHGRWLADAYYGDPNGFAYLATHIANERAKNPNVLLLDAGDTLQGNAFAQYFRNETPNPIMGGMNLLKYDAMTIGNHDYNFGKETFATMLGQANFTLLGNANVDDDGSYGFLNDNVEEYITKNIDGVNVTILGLTTPNVPQYELPSNIEGLTFDQITSTVQTILPQIKANDNPDVIVSLNHIGYDVYKGDYNCDTVLAQQVSGLDVIIGGHSHTTLDPSVMVTSTVNPAGTLVAQTYKYALNLGKVNIGFTGNVTDGYEIVFREGYLLPASEVSATTNVSMTNYLAPFETQLTSYTEQEIGSTTTPIDSLNGYTEETNNANLQTDAAVFKLAQEGVNVDFHLSGAMSNKKVADTAAVTEPYKLTINDMYALMPYENSLVAMTMNGPQLKTVLERAYRNYWYYNYTEYPWGGYSHYTTCMLDISKNGNIVYYDTPNITPTVSSANVLSLMINGQPVDFLDATKYYTVSTVNYLAAGSCNFNDDGATLWPLDQLVEDTQYYVRDSVIDYIKATGTIAPEIEGRLKFETEMPDTTVTILHTNDFHGRLETDYKGRGGSAYMATVLNDIRTAKGADNVVLMDAGDAYFAAPPISQLVLGESTIDIYNQLGYDVATFGNHEFDKGEAVVISRTSQSNFPWVGANIVNSGTDWTHPAWVKPYVTMTVGTAPNTVVLGIIGLDTAETPIISFAPDTLEFKEFTETILHYYDEIMAQSDALVVLAHQGTEDAGAYKGLKTVARELVDAGKPVSLMIGGHQHQLLNPAVVVSGTTIVQSGYYGRYLGDVEVTINAATNSLTVVTNTYHTINNSITPNAAISTSVAGWVDKVAPQLDESVGVTNIDLERDYNNESVMGDLVTDSMLWKANQIENGAVDIAFTNPGGLRANITGALPYMITWGNTFDVLPFGNALTVMDLTGAQVQALLDQSATLFKGTLQTSGASWSWYNDTGDATPTAWGAYGVKINGAPLESDKIYRVATNDFLATGKDGWVTFAEGTNRNEYLYADLQEALNEYIATITPIEASDVVGGRITKSFGNSVSADTTTTLTDVAEDIASIVVPAGAVSESITLVHSPIVTVSSVPSSFAPAGSAFSLDAFQNSSLQSDFKFDKPIIITLSYTDTDVAGKNESSLHLRYWNDSTWVDDGISCSTPANYQLVCTIEHLSDFATFTKSSSQIYLPVITRN